MVGSYFVSTHRTDRSEHLQVTYLVLEHSQNIVFCMHGSPVTSSEECSVRTERPPLIFSEGMLCACAKVTYLEHIMSYCTTCVCFF